MWEQVRRRIRRLRPPDHVESDYESLPSFAYLESLMHRYEVKDLTNVTPEAFKRRIDSFLGLVDHEMEGFASPERQRDLSIRFHWGHDHDFGAFFVPGKMRRRHIGVLASFVDRIDAIPTSLAGARVLDVGCWTGGTSLLLHAMGARVTAVEEVRKYVECVEFLADAFGIDDLDVRNVSLYECVGSEFADAYDFVLFAGVLYHVTDPVVALRITFTCLRPGGWCLLETESLAARKPVLAYLGPSVFGSGSAADLTRTGWDWFVPSPSAVTRMMSDVGYSDLRATRVGSRLFVAGRKDAEVDMLRAGVSMRGFA